MSDSYAISGSVPLPLLSAFVSFASSSGTVEAAAKLGITQPALSKQLKSLEAMMPHPLFSFQGRRKTLTPFGRLLFDRLKGRLGGLDEVIARALTEFRDPRQAVIRVGARREVLDRISHKLNFEGSLIFNESDSRQILESLIDRQIEIGIAQKVPVTGELIAKPLFKDEFHVVVPKRLLAGNPLPKSARGDATAVFDLLRGLPCLGYRTKDEILEQVCRYHDATLDNLRMIRATSNYHSLASMVESGLGWAVLPTYLSISKTSCWALALPGKVIHPNEFHLIFPRELSRVPWFRALLDDIRSCFAA